MWTAQTRRYEALRSSRGSPSPIHLQGSFFQVWFSEEDWWADGNQQPQSFFFFFFYHLETPKLKAKARPCGRVFLEWTIRSWKISRGEKAIHLKVRSRDQKGKKGRKTWLLWMAVSGAGGVVVLDECSSSLHLGFPPAHRTKLLVAGIFPEGDGAEGRCAWVCQCPRQAGARSGAVRYVPHCFQPWQAVPTSSIVFRFLEQHMK